MKALGNKHIGPNIGRVRVSQEDELSQIIGDIDEIQSLPQFNQTALPRGLTATGASEVEGADVNVPLPEPRVRDSNGQ